MRALLATTMLSLLLAACGQMGPLYMPDKEPPPAAQPEAATVPPEPGPI